MAERYEVFAEWNEARQKCFRIYDKETDCLLGTYSTLKDATRECARLIEAAARRPGDEPGSPTGASKSAGDHQHQQQD